MFSQQVASNLTDSPGKPAVASTEPCGDWGTAERYYRKGRFRFIAAIVETDPVAHIASSVRADDVPAVFISTIVQAEEPKLPAEQAPTLVVDEPATPSAMAPEFPSPEPLATVPPETPDTIEQESSIFDTLVQEDAPASVDVDMALQAEPEPQSGVGEIDVLPLPLGDPAGEMADFGVFSDDLGVPKSDPPPSGGGAALEQQYTQTDPYGIPNGHSMRYVDPRDLVRQRAAEKSENRNRRIEARKWMGYDPLRPSVTAVPYMTVPTTHPTLLVVPIVVRGGH